MENLIQNPQTKTWHIHETLELNQIIRKRTLSYFPRVTSKNIDFSKQKQVIGALVLKKQKISHWKRCINTQKRSWNKEDDKLIGSIKDQSFSLSERSQLKMQRPWREVEWIGSALWKVSFLPKINGRKIACSIF